MILNIILISLGIIFFFLPKYYTDKFNIFNILLSFTVFIIVFWNIYYTNDRYNYEVMISNIDKYNTDFIFKSIVNIGRQYNWGYLEIYHFHIIVISLFCILFISRFTNNILITVAILCVFRYVDYANQIRFYFGFFIALYSLFLLFIEKKILFAFILGVLSILSHSSLAIVFLIIPVYKILYRLTLKKQILYLFLALFLLPFIINVAISLFPQFAKYFTFKEGRSSLLGGIFETAPLLLVFALIAQNHNYITKHKEECLNDKKYIFLYTLSVFSFLIFPYGLFYRILIDRFVYSFSIVWLTLLIYSLKDYPNGRIAWQKIKILTIFLLLIVWFYAAPLIFLGKSFYLEEALKMLLIH